MLLQEAVYGALRNNMKDDPILTVGIIIALILVGVFIYFECTDPCKLFPADLTTQQLKNCLNK